MSYKPAAWIKQIEGKTATSGLNDLGGDLQNATKALKKIVVTIEDAMKVVEKFLQTYTDPVAPFLEKIKTFFSTVLNDILGISGGAILITPFNRTQKRYIQYRSSLGLATDKYKFNEVHLTTDATKSFYITVPPIEIPAMTPAEAFVEFQNSFSNTKDPWRPRWTNNTITTGFGVLIAMDDVDNVAPFLKSLESLATFFNFSDVKESLDKYRNQFATYAKDLDESMYKAIAQNLRGQGIVSDVTETVYTDEKGKIRKKLQASKFKIQTELPGLHWYALSIENIPGFRLLVDAYTTFLDWLIQTTQAANSAIWELFEIIKKRVFTLIELVENVVEALSSLFMLFSLGDMYTFSIEPEAGGAQHLLTSIQQSIQNPATEAATDISKIWTTADLSVLFFAGAGGPNSDAWNLLFNSLFPSTTATETESLDFTLNGIVDRAIYPLNYSYDLQFITENNDLYFTYTIQKADGTIVNQWTDYVSNKLYGNRYAGSFIIKEEGKYSLEMQARYDGIPKVETITYNFSVSSFVTSPVFSPMNEAPISVSLSEGFTGSVSISGADTGRIIDRTSVYGGGEASLGQTLNDSGLYELSIKGTDGSDVNTLIAIDSRYPLLEMNVLQSKIYLPTLPYTVKFNLFANVIKIYMNGSWTTINCPGYITFDEYNYFPVKYFLSGVWRDAVVQTSPIDSSFRDICS